MECPHQTGQFLFHRFWEGTCQEFPVKDLPVLCLTEEEQFSPKDALVRKGKWFADSGETQVLIYLPGITAPTFSAVQQMARGLAAINASPLYLAVEADMGKALGQAIAALRPDLPLCCVDGVHLEQGDYLDIGKPIADGTVLPVVVKTLIFGGA